jgi:hypothetical protein
METGLLVDGAQNGMLGPFVRMQRGVDFEFETLCDLVLNLNSGLQDVARRPGLSNGETVLGVDVFRLEITMDMVRLGIGISGDLEGNVGGGLGLDLEAGAVDVEILAQEVIRAFAQILYPKKKNCQKNGVLFSFDGDD